MKHCDYWACTIEVDDTIKLCDRHSMQLAQGDINRCPLCENFKEKRFGVCYLCFKKGTESTTSIVRPRQPIERNAIQHKSSIHKPSGSIICPGCAGQGQSKIKKGPQAHEVSTNIPCSQCYGKGYLTRSI